jgi:hypothetical protein
VVIPKKLHLNNLASFCLNWYCIGNLNSGSRHKNIICIKKERKEDRERIVWRNWLILLWRLQAQNTWGKPASWKPKKSQYGRYRSKVLQYFIGYSSSRKTFSPLCEAIQLIRWGSSRWQKGNLLFSKSGYLKTIPSQKHSDVFDQTSEY